jgi:adenylosuccinate lyase
VIDRYALPELRELFGERRRLQLWLRIELLAAEALHQSGVIPTADWERLRSALADEEVDPERAREIERESQHDVIAFLRSVTERLGPEGRWLHYGLTSSDVLDTATAVTLRDATTVVAVELARLVEIVRRLALQHRSTPMVGRSHGVHAEPITFGFKAAGWFAELERDAERLQRAGERIAVGTISGAVGSHANVSADVERHVCEALGLAADPAATQVVSRDRHAELLTTLAILGGTLERISVEVRHLQRTEVAEAFEPFGAGQQGSSAMPHKRNPILAERVSGLARLLRGDALVGLENMALWHERDISHSSAERIILPDSCILLDYMLTKLRDVVERLQVYPDRMAENLALTKGLYFSQSILLALTRAGSERKNAYEAVQRAAMKTWKGEGTFAENAKREPEIAARLSPEEIDRLCSLDIHFKEVDATFRALGLE